MSAAQSEVGFEVMSLRASLRGAFAMLEQHPNYGVTDSPDGEMICDVGQILIDARARLEAIYYKLDGMQVAPNE